MKIISIDKTDNHGEYKSTIKLTYDEVVLLQNALLHILAFEYDLIKIDKYKKLLQFWRTLQRSI